MSMSDLELLELVEKAKQKQRGPQGPAGVGIESIEQHEDNSFTIKLTTGEHKKITLPAAKDGAVGPQGVQGERGEPGSAGRPGRDGAPGADALPGVPGRDGDHVDTGVVNSQGELLLGLTSGKVINVGKVVGPAGQTGQRGPQACLERLVKTAQRFSQGHARRLSMTASLVITGSTSVPLKSASGSATARTGRSCSTCVSPHGIPVCRRLLVVALVVAVAVSCRTPARCRWSTVAARSGRRQRQGTCRRLGQWRPRRTPTCTSSIACSRDNVHVGVSAPRPPFTEGQLWFSTEETELTLFIYDGNDWVPASPPVSLDGVEDGIKSADAAANEALQKVGYVQMQADQDREFVKWSQEEQDKRLDGPSN